MTKDGLIKELERIKKLIVEEVETDELTDLAREQAIFDVEDAIEIIRENEE